MFAGGSSIFLGEFSLFGFILSIMVMLFMWGNNSCHLILWLLHQWLCPDDFFFNLDIRTDFAIHS